MTETKDKPPATLSLGIRGILETNYEKLASLLPSDVDVDRFIGTAVSAVANNPKLEGPWNRRTAYSVALAVQQAAILGLEVGSGREHAYLIPFKDEVKLMIGYKGLIHLAYRSGKVKTFKTGVVREGDNFEYDEGSEGFVRHSRNVARLDGEIVAFYAFMVTKDNGTLVEVMSRAEVEAIRDRSEGYQYALKCGWDNPWISSFSEMGRKTPARRLAKIAQFALNLSDGVAYDEADNAPEVKARRPRKARVIDEGDPIPTIPANGAEPEPEPEYEPDLADDEQPF